MKKIIYLIFFFLLSSFAYAGYFDGIDWDNESILDYDIFNRTDNASLGVTMKLGNAYINNDCGEVANGSQKIRAGCGNDFGEITAAAGGTDKIAYVWKYNRTGAVDNWVLFESAQKDGDLLRQVISFDSGTDGGDWHTCNGGGDANQPPIAGKEYILKMILDRGTTNIEANISFINGTQIIYTNCGSNANNLGGFGGLHYNSGSSEDNIDYWMVLNYSMTGDNPPYLPLPSPDSVSITTKDNYNFSLVDSTVTISNASYTNTTNTTNGVVTFYVADGLYNISMVSNNYYGASFVDWDTTNDLTANLTFHKARFIANERFRDYYTNQTINNFTINYHHSGNDTLELTQNSTTGNITSFLDWNNSYYAIIDNPNYEYKNITFNTTDNYVLDHNVYFYGINSIIITIRDEETTALINTQAVGITLYNDVYLNTYSTSNGTITLQNITPDSYSIKFNTSGYNIRIYSIAVSNRSSQTLNAYLTQADTETIFTIKDKGTLNPIENVLLTMYRFINSSWTPIESKYSDITGKVQVSYEEYTQYKFYLAKSGYDDLIFYLDPILFSQYTIQMEQTTNINATQDYDHVSIIYAPKFFQEGGNNFTFIIQCPYGELITYGFTLTYPTGTASNSGSNALGSQLESNITITSPTLYDTVRLDYFYESTVIGFRNFTFYYPIQIGSSNNTMAKSFSLNGTYGLGLLERALITVLIGILTVGVATLFGSTVGGIILCFIEWCYLVYVGFISIWLIIVSVVIGILLLSLRGDS